VSDQSANDVSVTGITAAEVVLSCTELQPTLDFFVHRLGFQLDRISPADDPRSALISGHGLRLLLRRESGVAPGVLRIACEDPAALSAASDVLHAPNGTRIELVEWSQPLVIPALREELLVSRAGERATWITGRAGMRYRDLIPGRLGGRFIASHIQIPDGGPVPDNVHFHAIRFQMIFCRKGWVRVVYEGQGPPFVLEAGDCVLQPALIRHRVLESSAGLEVVEIACPAEHDTFLDHELELPTAELYPDRVYGSQRFVRHQASDADWAPWRVEGFQCRDIGIAEASGGLAGAQVVRAESAGSTTGTWQHAGELAFLYVLAGSLTLEGATDTPLTLERDDSVVVPAGVACVLTSTSDDLELLEVRLPAD